MRMLICIHTIIYPQMYGSVYMCIHKCIHARFSAQSQNKYLRTAFFMQKKKTEVNLIYDINEQLVVIIKE